MAHVAHCLDRHKAETLTLLEWLPYAASQLLNNVLSLLLQILLSPTCFSVLWALHEKKYWILHCLCWKLGPIDDA